MCGIAGIIKFKDSISEADTKKLYQMCERMHYRGPDNQSFYQNNNIAFGHRRLAIIDLSSSANQPMINKNNNDIIVFNGEIYNFKEIKTDLANKGYTFETNSDTETILFAYQEWGNKFTEKLRGMWAIAIWNNAKKEVFLSRDRMGEKPFYYYISENYISFASNLSGLKPSIDKFELNYSAISDYLSYEFIPENKAIYKNVYKVEPAQNIIINNKLELSKYKYWNLDYQENNDIQLDDAKKTIKELIVSSVSEQLDSSDVPVGCFLSGGVDSGLITAIASQLKPNLTTFTMTVPDDTLRDESVAAKKIAQLHKTNHIEADLDFSCISKLPDLLKCIEPLGDSSLIPSYATSFEASKHLKVILSGDGGDEFFGGYGKPELFQNSKKIKNNIPKIFLKYISTKRIHPIWRNFRLHASGDRLIKELGLQEYLKATDAMPEEVRNLIFGENLLINNKNQGEYLIDSIKNFAYESDWQAILGLGIKTRLPNDFLLKTDTSTMFNSIESRCPLLDHRLIDFTSKLPYTIWKPDNHQKSLLKQIASEYNPKEIVYSAKKGFSIPVEKYFMDSWRKAFISLLKNGKLVEYKIINFEGVLKYLNKHNTRTSLRLDRQLYSILALEIWFRVFHEEESVENIGKHLIIK